MRESFKSHTHLAFLWLIIIALCLATVILSTSALDMLLAGSKSVTLEKTAATAKDLQPTGELYLRSSIQEDYIMSNDEDVQKILTSFQVNLGQNVVGTSKLDNGVDCSAGNIAKMRDAVSANNRQGKFAENVEMLSLITLCEDSNKLRAEEKNKAFVITLSEKCGYYIDFSDKEHAPKIALADGNSMKIDYDAEAMKVRCLPQKIQFLSNVEEYWAENADDRPIDQIKELLEKNIVSNFTKNYQQKASENAAGALKSLFCAMKFDSIVINGTQESCQK